MSFTITADSIPIYDTFGFADYWSGSDWVLWHKELLKKYQTDRANQIWADAWLDGVSVAGGGRGKVAGSGLVFDAVPVGDRTINPIFRDYLKANEFLYNAVYVGIGGLIAKPLGAGVDVVTGASGGITSISNMVNYIGKALPVIGVVGGIILVYVAYRNLPNKTA
jgi:hypothetical protein